MTGTQSSASPADSPIDGVFESGVFTLLDTAWGQVAVFVVGWIGIGLITAVVLRMRGHEFRPYAALGAILGPAFVFLAYDAVRRRESEVPISIAPAAEGTGTHVLVVGVGDLRDRGAAVAAVDSVGEVGPVTAAVPVEYEVAERVHNMGSPPPESGELTRLAETLERYSPGLMMLPGRVERAISEGVKETGAEWVVIVGGDSASVAPDLEMVLDTNVIRVDT